MRPQASNHGTSKAVDRPSTDALTAFREALELWSLWHQEEARTTQRLFAARRDPSRVEALLDALDEVREIASKSTLELLGS